MKIRCATCNWQGYTMQCREVPVYHDARVMGVEVSMPVCVGYDRHCPKCDDTNFEPICSPAPNSRRLTLSA